MINQPKFLWEISRVCLHFVFGQPILSDLSLETDLFCLKRFNMQMHFVRLNGVFEITKLPNYIKKLKIKKKKCLHSAGDDGKAVACCKNKLISLVNFFQINFKIHFCKDLFLVAQIG